MKYCFNFECDLKLRKYYSTAGFDTKEINVYRLKETGMVFLDLFWYLFFVLLITKSIFVLCRITNCNFSSQNVLFIIYLGVLRKIIWYVCYIYSHFTAVVINKCINSYLFGCRFFLSRQTKICLDIAVLYLICFVCLRVFILFSSCFFFHR